MGKGIGITVISRQPKVLSHKRPRGNVCDGPGYSGKSRKNHKALEAKIRQEELKLEAYLRKNAMYEKLFGEMPEVEPVTEEGVGKLLDAIV